MNTTESYLHSLYGAMNLELEKCSETLSTLPEGHLEVQYSKNSVRMYRIHTEHKQGSSGHRIPQRLYDTDFPIAKGIRDRFILRLKKKALSMNLKHLKLLLENYISYDDPTIISQLKEPYKTLPGFEHLLASDHTPVQSENPKYRQYLVHKNSVGELFRSKSEMHISEMLLSMNIPYRYEMKLEINGEIKYPDFVIKRPGSDEKKYIEYFGMLEKNDYEERNFDKINWYLNHGFVPGRNILFLFENTNSGIDLIATQNQIQMLLAA